MQMAEPITQRMSVTFTMKRAENGRLFIACDPLESEPEPVVPGSHPTESEVVIQGSKSDPILISGLFTFEIKEGITEEQATYLANCMTDMLSHLMYTPL
jgi:hypothetical protein